MLDGRQCVRLRGDIAASPSSARPSALSGSVNAHSMPARPFRHDLLRERGDQAMAVAGTRDLRHRVSRRSAPRCLFTGARADVQYPADFAILLAAAGPDQHSASREVRP